MKRLFYQITLFCFLLLFIACAGKQPAEPSVDAIYDKEDVLRLVNDFMPNICEYRGRANIKFTERGMARSSAAMLVKECRGDMDIKILGPFGIGLAEFLVRGDKHFIIQGGKDVTDSYIFAADADDLVMLRDSLPPPTPESDFRFTVGADNYIFAYSGGYISVTSDFYVNTVRKGNRKIDYFWEEGVLKSIRFSRGDMELAVEFIDQWK